MLRRYPFSEEQNCAKKKRRRKNKEYGIFYSLPDTCSNNSQQTIKFYSQPAETAELDVQMSSPINKNLKEALKKLDSPDLTIDCYSVYFVTHSDMYYIIIILSTVNSSLLNYEEEKQRLSSLSDLDNRQFIPDYDKNMSLVVYTLETKHIRLLDNIPENTTQTCTLVVEFATKLEDLTDNFQRQFRPDMIFMDENRGGFLLIFDIPVDPRLQFALANNYSTESFYLWCNIHQIESSIIFAFGWLIWILVEGSGTVTPDGSSPEEWLESIESFEDYPPKLMLAICKAWEQSEEDNWKEIWAEILKYLNFHSDNNSTGTIECDHRPTSLREDDLDVLHCFETNNQFKVLESSPINTSEIWNNLPAEICKIDGFTIYKSRKIGDNFCTMISLFESNCSELDYDDEKNNLSNLTLPNREFYDDSDRCLIIYRTETEFQRLIDHLPGKTIPSLIQIIYNMGIDLRKLTDNFKYLLRPDTIFVNEQNHVLLLCDIPVNENLQLALAGGKLARSFFLDSAEGGELCERDFMSVNLCTFGWFLWILVSKTGSNVPEGSDPEEWMEELENYEQFPDIVPRVIIKCWAVSSDNVKEIWTDVLSQLQTIKPVKSRLPSDYEDSEEYDSSERIRPREKGTFIKTKTGLSCDDKYPDSFQTWMDTISLMNIWKLKLLSTCQFIEQKSDFQSLKKVANFTQFNLDVKTLKTNFTFIVVGAVNSGKSSLINLLLQDRHIPANEVPTTERCLVISNYEVENKFKVNIHQWDNNKVIQESNDDDTDDTMAEIIENVTEKLVDDEDTEKTKTRYISVNFNNPILSQSVNFIECPAIDGTKSFPEVEDMITRHPFCGLVYVFDSSDLVTINDENFLIHIRHKFPQVPIFFVANKVDVDEDNFGRDQMDYGEGDDNVSHLLREEEKFRIDTIQEHLERIDFLTRDRYGKATNFAALSISETEWEMRQRNRENHFVVQFSEFMNIFTQYTKLIFLRYSLTVYSLSWTLLKAGFDSQSSVSRNAEIATLTTEIKRMLQHNKEEKTETIRRVKRALKHSEAEMTTKAEELHLYREDPVSIINQMEIFVVNFIQEYLKSKQFLNEIEAHRDAQINRAKMSLQRYATPSLGSLSNLKEFTSIDDYSSFLTIVNTIFEWHRQLFPPVHLKNVTRCFGHRPQSLRSFFATVKYQFSSSEMNSARGKKLMALDYFLKFSPEKLLEHNFDEIERSLQHMKSLLKVYKKLVPSKKAIFINIPMETILANDMILEVMKTSLKYGVPEVTDASTSQSTFPSLFPYRLVGSYGAYKPEEFMIMRFPYSEETMSAAKIATEAPYLFSNRILSNKTLTTLARFNGLTMDYNGDIFCFLTLHQSDLFVELTSDRNDDIWSSNEQAIYIALQIAKVCAQFDDNGSASIKLDLRPENILFKISNGSYRPCLMAPSAPDRNRPYPNGQAPFHYHPRQINDVMYQIKYLVWWLLIRHLKEIDSNTDLLKIMRNEARNPRQIKEDHARLMHQLFKEKLTWTSILNSIESAR